MEFSKLEKLADGAWRIPATGTMRVPAVVYASEGLIRSMDEKVGEQISNVCALPGIVNCAYCMPDAHWGYGFPIGGVAAFDPEEAGVVSAGGVGFDISCGVRLIHTKMKREELRGREEQLANVLYKRIPAGVGSHSDIVLGDKEMSRMLKQGAHWALERGLGEESDLLYTEENGRMEGANPRAVSERAKKRQSKEVGTLGSGNHYLEVQVVKEIYHTAYASQMGLELGDVVVSIHCGSRGLGHQIASDYLLRMVASAQKFGISLPDRDLACAPIKSGLGEDYIGAMRAGINCAFANRQTLTHFTRVALREVFGNRVNPVLVYDVSHNTCKEEVHEVDGRMRKLFVHRKGATRAFGPGHPELPDKYKNCGQPVIIGGSMGVGSHVLTGTKEGEGLCFSSSCHGAGRAMSRSQAKKTWSGGQLIQDLKEKGVIIRSSSFTGVAEEAPGAYKDVFTVVDSAQDSGISRKVAYLAPLICVKG